MKQPMIIFLAVFILSVAVPGVQAQTDPELKYLVESMNKEMIEMAKAGRFEAMGKFYDANALSLPNYRVMIKGYKAILNDNLGKKKGGYTIIDGQKLTTALISGTDIMVDIGQYSLTVTFPGLSQPKVDSGKYMNVWKKDGEGKWRIVAETWNADKSPNAPATGTGNSNVKVGQPVKTAPAATTQPGTQSQPAKDNQSGK